MPYTTKEALIVALYNANVEPLFEAADIADKVFDNLKSMGFAIIDVHHKSDLEVAQAAYDAGYPSVMSARLSHLKAVEDAPT